MKTFTVVALAACASMVTASPLDMLRKRQVFRTIVTTDENGAPFTYVEETVPETVVVATTLDPSTTTVWHTSALIKTNLPLLSVLVQNIPIVSRIVNALNPSSEEPAASAASESPANAASDSAASASAAPNSAAPNSAASANAASNSAASANPASASAASASPASANPASASAASASAASASPAGEPASGVSAL
ncbi:hypothetical protein K492DRAFT_189459 [Lichtheimia hyalospora FSU 10163]|nr:hypothetical protein K492DRAFT_189459 [Lichtheimia hyalospora FSU 10163]